MTERTNDEVTALKEEVTLMREAIRKLTENAEKNNEDKLKTAEAANAAKERNKRIIDSVPTSKG